MSSSIMDEDGNGVQEITEGTRRYLIAVIPNI